MKNFRVLASCLFLSLVCLRSLAAEPAKYVRFQHGETVAYGLLEGDRVRQLAGDLFADWRKTDTTYRLADVKLLPPTRPTQVLALAGNYRSHLRDTAVPEKFAIPQPFYKSPSCLVGHDDAIVIPRDAKVVHYEGELVIVIGKSCSKVSKEEAPGYVFGVTAGNDVSERVWQNDQNVKDVQWWRAKGADTFGPVGPCIATGLDYGKLSLRLRLNGQVKQEENTDHLIHDVASAVSFISQYVTLHPGDLIFTGTPGETSDIKAGDVVEVELEGVGVLRNPVVSASR
jgi:2-keto-4-pentenoate hydratase/2-oxohepta-3-ene-1,7-dioic acid hydratase in catechol pathway